MKEDDFLIIKNVEAIPLKYYADTSIMDSFCYVNQRNAVLVKIETDDGIIGYGEAGSYGGSVEATAVVIEKEFKPLLIGEDPLLKEKLWTKLFKKCYQHGRSGIILQAIAGIDVALWDITGKFAGLPVYKLLGGYENTLRVYASCGFYAEGKGLKELAQEMKDKVDKGFTAVKMKIGRISSIRGSKLPILPKGDICNVSIEEDIKRVEAVREAIGNDIDLLVDANSSWDFKTAITMAKELEKLNVYYIEEPVVTEDLESSARLAAATTIPIAGYETAYTKFEFKDIILKKAVDIVQPDVAWAGGLTECMKIASLADSFSLPVIPHCFSSALCLAANLHFGAAIPTCELVEFDQNYNPLRDELITNPFEVSNGYVTLSEKPGLGIEINEDIVEKYRIEI